MCLVESGFNTLSVNIGQGHGSVYGTIEGSIAHCVVDAYFSSLDRGVTAGSIFR